MTNESAQGTPVTRVEIPFPSLDELKTILQRILIADGIFIETAYPPAVGTHIEMIFVVGKKKEEVARFLSTVIAQQAKNLALADRKGVQLQFERLFPNALELFSQFIALAPELTSGPSQILQPPTPAEPIPAPAEEEIIEEGLEIVEEEVSEPAKEIMSLKDADLLEGAIAKSVSANEETKEMTPVVEQSSLAEDLVDYTKRPDAYISGETKQHDLNPYQDGAVVHDDLSHLQGSGGYEMSDIILGIDLGTCNSCVSVFKDGNLRVLTDEKGFATTPSVVSYTEEGKVIVGREAISLMAENPRTSIFGAKRFIGRNYHSPIVQNMIRFFPYKLVPSNENHTAIDIFGKAVSLESVSAEVLKYMVHVAQDALHEEVDKVIITVPAYYSDNQRAAVKEAGTLAGLKVVRIINEPTAAALAFGFHQKMNKRILVYDFGGGTLDVSILEIKDDTFKVIATGGDTFLGGEDFDNRMVKWVLESSREEGVLLAKNPITFERLKQACEKAKRELSTKRETSVNLPYIQTADGKTLNFQKLISREHFVHLTRDLVERSIQICDTVLKDSKVSVDEIEEIILVGGMTRVPFIRNSVHQHYGKKPFGEVNPDEAVAMGAALLGGEMVGKKGVSLTDVLSMSIGIALPRNRFKPILMKNTSVPCIKKYRINADLSTEFTIDIFQGDTERCDQNEYLGTLVFSDEVKGPSNQSLEIEFNLNAECLLNCVIRNPATGKAEKALLITHDTPPSTKLA